MAFQKPGGVHLDVFLEAFFRDPVLHLFFMEQHVTWQS